jgi:two-component system CheB/CheR fusion protein
MLSANEEFQSTNEELETSKEELQSTNEELTTTIEELRNRNRELGVVNTELGKTRVTSDRARAFADIIIETVREPLAVLDSEQRIQRVNEAFLTDLQVRREEVEHHFLHEVRNGLLDIPELRQRLRAAPENGTGIENAEVPVEIPGRGRRIRSLSARKIPGDAERAEFLLVGIEDVTARTNSMADLLADSQRKDEFLAMLAHELRHPLTPIAHATHLLRVSDADPTRADLYETIDTQTQQLLRFVDELMDVARLGRNNVEVQRERVDLASIVRDAANSVQPTIRLRQLHLKLDLPTTPVLTNGDPWRLNQVVTNLLDNAAKFSSVGGEIAVKLEPNGKDAVLRVRDHGVGIAQEDLERVFDLFTQTHTAPAPQGGGLGLGLSIVRSVLELHGGRIRAYSAGPGTGAEFVAWIPLLPVEKELATKPERRNAVSPVAPPVRAKRVLIVDDHKEITTSLTRLLRAWGHEIAVAHDADSAMSVAEKFRPEFAILDLGLPGESGYALARRLREAFPPDKLRLIALTGHSEFDVRDECRAAGFEACLVKPGGISELAELLGRD